MNIFIVIGIILFVLSIIVLWLFYKITIGTAIILSSAGKMKTGNDLWEQIDDTMKNEDIPNIFQFYWILIRGRR